MTVADLIRELEKLPADKIVFVASTFDCGYGNTCGHDVQVGEYKGEVRLFAHEDYDWDFDNHCESID